jgi:ABC-type dipeptide/oligopeptide/nickel transport system permease subunit
VKHLSTRKARIRFEIRRFKDFLKIFVRDKRGILGLAILVGFTTIAAAAPLITPYDPIDLSRHPTKPPIADVFAKPIWYKYLPLGEELSENVEPMQDSHFNTASSLEELQLTSNVTDHSVSLQFASDIGIETEENKKGCAALVFSREIDENPLGIVEANLTKVFYYPYKAPPNRFVGQVVMLVNASEGVSVTIDLVIEKEGGERRLEWWSQTFNSSGTKWITPTPLIDSASADIYWLRQKFGPEWAMNPSRKMFSEQGSYRYGLEITFNDTQRPKGERAQASVYIDDFYIRLFGSSFGLLGTDKAGRDIFTQLIYGARISLTVGLLAAFFSTIIGLLIGLTAGYIGKFVDQILMRFTDMLLVIPDTPLYIVLMSVLSPSIWTLILLISLIGWTGFARIVRSSVLSIRERSFIEGARAVGAGRFHIIMRHILPNVMNLVYVTLAMAVPNAITSEAWLSWLGLYDPKVMTWGRMLHDAEDTAQGIRMWWWIVPPGLSIAAISLSFILLGYALDKVLNPKLRERY